MSVATENLENIASTNYSIIDYSEAEKPIFTLRDSSNKSIFLDNILDGYDRLNVIVNDSKLNLASDNIKNGTFFYENSPVVIEIKSTKNGNINFTGNTKFTITSGVVAEYSF